MSRFGSFSLRLLLCQLALLVAGSVARAGIAAPGPGSAPTFLAGKSVEVIDSWVPYVSEFREASQWLIALGTPRGGLSDLDDQPASPVGAEVSDAFRSAELPSNRRIIELCFRLKMLLAAMGMSSPAGRNVGGAGSPPVAPADCVSEREPFRPDAAEPFVIKRQPFPVLILASRLFRPPRAAFANLA